MFNTNSERQFVGEFSIGNERVLVIVRIHCEQLNEKFKSIKTKYEDNSKIVFPPSA